MTDNIAPYNAVIAAKNEKKVQDALKELDLQKPRIREKRELIREVARRTGIAESTFSPTRNLTLYSLVLHFISEPHGAVRSVDPKDASRELLLAQLADAQLQVKNLAKKIERQAKRPPSNSMDELDYRIAFEDTAKLLQMVIERSEGVIELDTLNKLIIDRMAQHKHSVIGEPPRTAAFFRWLRSDRS